MLTGRHGLLNCYEAFIHIVDSMFNQHAKWLKTSRETEWRRPIASLNYLLTSHVWQQDHNGFSHQDPGFVDHVVNKKADIVRVYFPPDANTLLYVTDHCLRSWDRINVIVAGKAPQPQWLDMDTAIKHCTQGIGIWEWASNDRGSEPDIVMACAGDVPTLETLPRSIYFAIISGSGSRRQCGRPELATEDADPHGLTDSDFDALFTADKPVIFAYHGYPALIHRLTYKRTNHDNMHVRGFQEEGTTTTPFDMVVRNHLDRFHLVADVIDFGRHSVPRQSMLAGHSGQAGRTQTLYRRAWRRPARSTRLALARAGVIAFQLSIQLSRGYSPISIEHNCVARSHGQHGLCGGSLSSNCLVWRATIRFSLVGTTHAETREAEGEMRGPPAALACPSTQPDRRCVIDTRARISAACSPMPRAKRGGESANRRRERAELPSDPVDEQVDGIFRRRIIAR